GGHPSRLYAAFRNRRSSQLLAALQRCRIHRSRHLLSLFFSLITAVEAFGAVLVEPHHSPMKLDYGTPSVSGLALVFGFEFAFAFAFDHAQPPAQQVREPSNVWRYASRLILR